MKIKDLIERLQEFDEDAEIGGVIVSYVDHQCGDEYCYCCEIDYELSIVKQDKPDKPNKYKTFVPKIWIR